MKRSATLEISKWRRYFLQFVPPSSTFNKQGHIILTFQKDKACMFIQPMVRLPRLDELGLATSCYQHRVACNGLFCLGSLLENLPGNFPGKRRRSSPRNTRNRRVVDEQRTRADARQTCISHLLHPLTSLLLFFVFSNLSRIPSLALVACPINQQSHCKYHFTPTMQSSKKKPRGPTKSQIPQTMPRPALPARSIPQAALAYIREATMLLLAQLSTHVSCEIYSIISPYAGWQAFTAPQ